MAGAFSGHLINSFYTQQARYSTPFGSQNQQIITSGPMSFNASMQGTPAPGNQPSGDYSFSFGSAQPSFFNPELSEATTLKIAALQAKLNQKLGPEYISQRPGPGGGPKLTYAEGWKIINLANEVFGFNGWSSQVVSLTTDFIDYNEESRRHNVGVTAIVRVTLRDGVFHEDIGYGMLENSKGKGAALDKCKKEAVTDGLKRALRNFGNLLGNCLYDKTYTQEVIKIKVPQPKFDKNELHRRPEFEETKPNIASTSSHSPATSSRLRNITMNLPTNTDDVKPITTAASTSASSSRLAAIATGLPSNNNNSTTGSSPVLQQEQPKILSSVPSHIRAEIKSVSGLSRNVDISTPSRATNSLSGSGAAPDPNTGNPSILPPGPTRHAPVAAPANNKSRPTAHPGVSNAPRPPALQPQANHPIMTEDGDESFHFGSDDDAFLASVDLGEGDLGAPVLPETDLGRPLFDAEEDGYNSRIFGMEEVQAHSTLPRERPQQNAPRVGMLSSLLPQNQVQQQNRQQWSSNQSTSTSNRPQQLHPINDKPRLNDQFKSSTSSHVSNQNPTHRSHLNQNQPPVTDSLRRPSTPTMGGFYFPPGVDPRMPSGEGSASGIGMKRTSESMSSSTTSRPGPGMDGSSARGQVKREVLGRLDLGDGGDVKRVRR